MTEKKEIALEIVDIDNRGQGIGKLSGLAVFVAPVEGLQPIPGDIVCAEIAEQKKNFAKARMLAIQTPSPLRISPLCPHAASCGGCDLQEMQYDGQLVWKERQVREKLSRLGGVNNPLVRPILGMENSDRYRNKARIPADKGAVGFYRRGSHTVVDCTSCMINSEAADAVAAALRKELPKGIREVTVRTGVETGEVMVILTAEGRELSDAEKLILRLDDAVAEVSGGQFFLESVYLHSGREKEKERYRLMAGKPTIVDRIGELSFEISPASFYQINPAQTKRLYDQVKAYADLSGVETVLDVYCGVGTIGLYLAKDAQKVLGIESVKASVLDANRNAVINGIVNAEFLCGNAEEVLPRLAKEGIPADVLVLDPPRAGCKPELLVAAAEMAPKRILYVSCDLATLARDVKLLEEKGYRFVEATPVDMFPMSLHVECVVLMSRVDK